MKNGLIEARFLLAPSGFVRVEAAFVEFMPWGSRRSRLLLKRCEEFTILESG